MTGRVCLSERPNGVPAAALKFLALVVILLLASLPLRGQSGEASRPLRTPWGDPDLQGNYTNLWELGTPLERPDQFAGRRLEDIKTGLRTEFSDRKAWKRLAVVTDIDWIEQAMELFAWAMPGELKVFDDLDELDEAKAWAAA